MKKYYIYILYAVVLVVLFLDLLIALFGIVRSAQGENMVLLVLISLINPFVFAWLFFDDADDIYQEEIDKRMSEALQDYGLDKNSFLLKEN